MMVDGNEMTCIHNSLSPELFAQTSIGQHTSNFLQQGLIHAFCHPILLRSISNCKVSRYAFLLTEYRKLIISIFCSIVRFEYFNLPPCLVLHHFLPYKKCFEHLIFGFHRIHPNFSGKVINECNKVMFTSQGSRLGWSSYVCVNIIQYTFSIMDCGAELHPFLLSQNTLLAKIQLASLCTFQ